MGEGAGHLQSGYHDLARNLVSGRLAARRWCSSRRRIVDLLKRVQNSSRLCKNSEFAEKWLVSTEFLRFGGPVMDENRRKSAETH
jgi:hypothetical protein